MELVTAAFVALAGCLLPRLCNTFKDRAVKQEYQVVSNNVEFSDIIPMEQ